MLFNSIDFAIFLPLVFISFWFIIPKSNRCQNLFLLFVSYVFYSWWDWRFLSLIIISSIVDYLVGISLGKEENIVKRKYLLLISICVNIGLLGFFKYSNFFIESFITAFSFFGNQLNYDTFYIILPVGISFYTFQTLSYSIDVYERKMNPSKDVIAFFAFVSFFPQLVAGPIERAANLLPQFFNKRKFDYAKAIDGMRQILWGFFKKLVIADNCAPFVNEIFSHHGELPGSILWIGILFFTFQIYCDFSGYSDIAIGTARLFNFSLNKNFDFPYFSRDIAEFWRRWHISLSSWFRDYVYIPMGGSYVANAKKIRNLFVVFLLSGFWHGANWTFIIWGAINAVYYLPLMFMQKNRKHLDVPASGRLFPSFLEARQITVTFFMTLIAWVFFRANNITHAFEYLDGMFSLSVFVKPNISVDQVSLIMIIFIFVIVEWTQREKEYTLETVLKKYPRTLRWIGYIYILIFIIGFGGFEKTEFIYFAF